MKKVRAIRASFRRFSCLLLAFCALSGLQAKSLVESHRDRGYSLRLHYNEQAQPGDAVFVRLQLEPLAGSGKNAGSKMAAGGGKNAAAGKAESSGSLALISDGKSLGKTDFYSIAPDTFLAGLPLSSYLEAGSCQLQITYRPFGAAEERVSLPLTILKKEFVRETIPLDSANTSIKTNYSKERMAQIERLNAILGRRNVKAVYGTSAFLPPTPEKRRTSFFADRRIFTYTGGGSSTSLHYGIDYGVPTGSEVRACGAGRVVMAEDRISTGWSVCIEHLPGLYSLYYHMSRLDVKEGDMVSPGSLIGLSGATGLATGPHLHWEVRLNMEAVSPDFFLQDFAFEKAH